MLKLVYDSDGKRYECALQFMITDDRKNIYGASFVGFPSAAWTVNSAMRLHKHVKLYSDETTCSYYYPFAGMHQAEKKVGKLVHVLSLPYSALPPKAEKLEKYTGVAVILSWDGDLKKAIGEYLAKTYNLPWEWVMEYHKLFYVQELQVVSDPELGELNLKAARVQENKEMWQLRADMVDLMVSEALRHGRLKLPKSDMRGTYEEGQTLQEYLQVNASVFATQVSQVKPLYNPATADKLDRGIIMDRIPFPLQAHAIQAIVESFKKRSVVFLNGEMGTGKSIISVGVSNVLHRRKNKPMSVLIITPGMVIPKWCNLEIGSTLRDAKITRISSREDVERYEKKKGPIEFLSAETYLNKVQNGYKPEGLEFVLLGIDRAKLGPSSWFGSVHWKRIAGTKTQKGWHCPDCGTLLTKVEDKETVPYEWDDFITSPPDETFFDINGYPRKGAAIKWKQRPPLKKCPECETVLQRPAIKYRGETNMKNRWYPALILKRLRKHFDLLIVDEAHYCRADDSGRGFAFSELVKASKKTLCLTGTLLNGMSTSVKELLWRTTPRELMDMGFDSRTGSIRWANKYGVVERTEYPKEGEDEGVVTKKKSHQAAKPIERPGISPELVADHLLHQTVFLDLTDMNLPLVKMNEEPLIVDLDEAHLERYKSFHKRYLHAVKKSFCKGHRGAYSGLISTLLAALDRPDIDTKVTVDEEEIVLKGFGSDYYSSKEKELVRQVRSNIENDRGVVVYCFYTDRYKVHHRIRDVLKAHGVEDVVVMESSVTQEKRVEWLQQQAEKGTKVIICNMKLVMCGLDLLDYPTIIFYQLDYNIDNVRQSGRRNWRIGQMRFCETIYLVANETQQMSQFKTCLEKRAHALLAEGRLDKSELTKYVPSRGRMTLAYDLAHCIADEDIGERWTELAKKDMEEIEMYDEEEFREVLKAAHERLANETLRLCGMEEEEIETIDVPAVVRPSFGDISLLPPKRTGRKKKLPDGVEQLTLIFEEAV